MQLSKNAIPPRTGQRTIGDRIASVGAAVLRLVLEGIAARAEAVGTRHER